MPAQRESDGAKREPPPPLDRRPRSPHGRKPAKRIAAQCRKGVRILKTGVGCDETAIRRMGHDVGVAKELVPKPAEMIGEHDGGQAGNRAEATMRRCPT